MFAKAGLKRYLDIFGDLGIASITNMLCLPHSLCMKLQLADSLSFTRKSETLVVTLEVVAMVYYHGRAS